MRPLSGDASEPESLDWMILIIQDMVAMGYAQVKCQSPALSAVEKCHVALWRCALSGRDGADALRRELSRLAALAGVSDSAVEWVNRQIMAELLHTVAARHSRSPRRVSRLSFEVARAACGIAQARPFSPSAQPAEKRKAGALL